MVAKDHLTDHPGHRVQNRMEGEEGDQRTEYRDDRATNCGGILASGNCSGDSYWNIPDTDWWTWPGIGGSASNRSAGSILASNPTNPGYDFAGGQTTSNTPIADSQVNTRHYTSSYSVLYDTPAVEVQRRTYSNCTTGVTVNCYSNCNCNCACACACNCDCVHPCCCVSGDTMVWMADFSYKRVDEIAVGESIMTMAGAVAVKGVDITSVGERPLYEVNGVLNITGDHSFWITGKGWASIDPAASDASKNQYLDVVIDDKGTTEPWLYEGITETPKQLAVGDISNGIMINSIEQIEAEQNQPLYTLVTGGYMIGDQFVLSAWATDEIDL